MKRLLIKNGTIVTHDKTIYNMDILIENGKIFDIDTNITLENCNIIDAKNMLIIPGLVDMHCDIGEPGFEYKENLITAGNSAAKGGFTSITCNPNTLPVIDNKTVVEYILSRSKSDCIVNVYPYGSMTKECLGIELAEIAEMQIAGVVAISDGDKAIQDNAVAYKIFRYASMFDLPVITHCEDKSISNNSGVNGGYISTFLGLKSAPKSAETIMLTRNILLAMEFNVPLHITHVSTGESVRLIRLAKKNGAVITAETSPQYFILDEKNVLNYNTMAKFNPPLRKKEDIEEIIKGIKDGTIDVISSDHQPNTIDSKRLEYDLASFGIPSFETAFPLAYTYLVDKGFITLETLIDRMSTKPAQILGINKGKITVGLDADLVIFNPDLSTTIHSKEFLSKAKYSIFNDTEVSGCIVNTIINGKSV